jgi:hypothetical protein
MVGRIGQLAKAAHNDLADLYLVGVQDRLPALDRDSVAMYFVVPYWW